MRKELVGKKFGRLIVVLFNGIGTNRNAMWLCSCVCGGSAVVSTNSLTSGNTRSCGCLHKEFTSTGKAGTKHGGYGTPEYRAYSTAKQRCCNPDNENYPAYGGRGIEFNFVSFEEFYQELGNKPSSKYSLDRINNDGNYEIGNVRWATKSEQCRNQRCNNCVALKRRISELEKLLEKRNT